MRSNPFLDQRNYINQLDRYQ